MNKTWANQIDLKRKENIKYLMSRISHTCIINKSWIMIFMEITWNKSSYQKPEFYYKIKKKSLVVRWSFLDVILRSYKTIIVKKMAEFLSSYHEGYKLFSRQHNANVSSHFVVSHWILIIYLLYKWAHSLEHNDKFLFYAPTSCRECVASICNSF